MEALMIVGADRLGAIPDHLQKLGVKNIIHINGRKVKQVQREIPEHVELILVLTDFINHNLSKKLKEKASKQSVPVCYAKRSWCSIYKALSHCDSFCEQCPLMKEER
ncbi:DUF2325 domain-containing protein [Thalassorhabdus alkalitolerans]|uniref:DUF2325 domain-containing protein n=1 Tax=Thalassorhabdus alkalitolerans TaxID=2282697 RepID=A0ABW0YSV7_9BACI